MKLHFHFYVVAAPIKIERKIEEKYLTMDLEEKRPWIIALCETPKDNEMYLVDKFNKTIKCINLNTRVLTLANYPRVFVGRMYRLRNPSNNLNIYAIQVSGTEEVKFDVENNNILIIKRIADDSTLALENADKALNNSIYSAFSLTQFREGDFVVVGHQVKIIRRFSFKQSSEMKNENDLLAEQSSGITKTPEDPNFIVAVPGELFCDCGGGAHLIMTYLIRNDSGTGLIGLCLGPSSPPNRFVQAQELFRFELPECVTRARDIKLDFVKKRLVLSTPDNIHLLLIENRKLVYEGALFKINEVDPLGLYVKNAGNFSTILFFECNSWELREYSYNPVK